MIKEYYTETLWCISVRYQGVGEMILRPDSINENKN